MLTLKELEIKEIPKQAFATEFKELAVTRATDVQSIPAATKELGLRWHARQHSASLGVCLKGLDIGRSAALSLPAHIPCGSWHDIALRGAWNMRMRFCNQDALAHFRLLKTAYKKWIYLTT